MALLTSKDLQEAKNIINQHDALRKSNDVLADSTYTESMREYLGRALDTIDELKAVLGEYVNNCFPGSENCQCASCKARRLYQNLK